jgi:hypothetical protein
VRAGSNGEPSGTLSGKLVSQDQPGLGGQKGYSPLDQGTSRFRDCAGARGSHIMGVCKKQGRATHGGRLVKHAGHYWLLLAEGQLTRRKFAATLRRVAALPVPAG